MLGSNSGAGAPLRDGIYPQHAVSVIDYNEQNGNVTVLDPYGHTRVISENSIMKNYTIIIAEKKN